MSTTITHGDDTITPTLVLGYAADREGQNRVHPIVGSERADVTFRPAKLRRGTLRLGFAGASSETDSLEAESLHALGGLFMLLSTDRASVEMSYVVDGRITRELEDVTRKNWVVSVEFQEVAG